MTSLTAQASENMPWWAGNTWLKNLTLLSLSSDSFGLGKPIFPIA
jgi:hypothetical protein